ncbi:hypothetical protein [Massilia aerilata]|uniref:Uncharacterized protein n=1 Tax=Massilia aerilata TaxID=453817 RepID=A0ABW0RVK5_9BURK
MKTLTITDLARTETLDRSAMHGVRGGFKFASPSYSFGNIDYAPSDDSSIHATQNLGQVQNVMNATANGSAFLEGVSVHNKVSQDGQNTIVRR